MSRKKPSEQPALVILTSVSEVLEKLGGYAAAGAMVGRSPQASWNWTVQHTLPSNTYFAHRAALNAKGFDAPPRLWGMTMPIDQTAPSPAAEAVG